MLPYGSGYGSIAYTKRYQSVSRTESENSLPHIFYSNLHSKNYSEAKTWPDLPASVIRITIACSIAVASNRIIIHRQTTTTAAVSPVGQQ